MLSQLNPYLTFNGNCREAMTFYQECLGGELTLQSVGESPAADRCPEGTASQIMHSSLMRDDLLLMATDMVAPQGYIVGNHMSLSLNFNSEEEIKAVFEKLSNGGIIVDSLKKQFWGALFGVVVDKFGMAWMLNCDVQEK